MTIDCVRAAIRWSTRNAASCSRRVSSITPAGSVNTSSLTGRPAVSVIRHPHSFYFIELFKIVNGRIRQVEAAFITVPYNMPSPWR